MTGPASVRLLAAGAGVVALVLSLGGCGGLTTPPAAAAGSPSSASSSASMSAGPGPVLSASPYPSASVSGTPVVAMPSPAGVNGADVDAVALAAVSAIESSDTTVDADPNDTVKRAAGWLTPAFAAQVRAYPPVAAPGARWNLWAAHRAYLTVTTSLAGDDHPVDTPVAAYRQVVAVLHPVGRDGWVGPVQTTVVFVSLAPVNGQWRLGSEQSS